MAAHPGYGIAGPIECSSDTDMTRQFEVNVFGAIQKMSKDELAGSRPEGLARFIFKLAHRKRRPRALVGYEFKYRLILFLAKLLPTSISNALMGRIYAR